jgi:sporulation protein YlmC with PRC-barrel domain
MMPRRPLILAALLLAGSSFAGPAATTPVPTSPAPGGKVPSPVTAGIPLGLTAVQTDIIAGGIRASKLLGAEVYNDRNENIGTVEDVVMATDGSLSVAIIDAGSYFGGERRVAIPVQQFHQLQPRPVLPRVDREALKQLPEFAWPAPPAEK